MDYVLGSVAALISGNVTPNRPKRLRKADTPMKHQPSPNVTPKSQPADDRSIFLSPSVQKKKAIVKKSPKRIFQNPDLDITKEDDESSTITSPKADKVKKHLKEELDSNSSVQTMLSPKSPKKQENESKSPSSNKKLNVSEGNISDVNKSSSKKRKRRKSVADQECLENRDENIVEEKENIATNLDVIGTTSPKKKAKKSKLVSEEVEREPDINTNDEPKLKKNKSNQPAQEQKIDVSNKLQSPSPKKKNKKRKNKNKKAIEKVESETDNKNAEETNKNTCHAETEIESTAKNINETTIESQTTKKKNKKRKNKKQKSNNNIESIEVNANAITNEDTDSEHESDNEIESENDEINKKALQTAPPDTSENEAEDVEKKEKNVDKTSAEHETHVVTKEEVQRTLFVGNVPFSKKCKKEIKKIFVEYGQIETVRIRTIPVKDATVTPKLAVVKNELHPARSTVNVYVKFADSSCVERALAANNTVLHGNHLRVSRSETTGELNDSKCAIFVGNMPFALEDETLRAKFEKCGEIVSVRIIRDSKTNAGKGFGYVNFASKDGVELALKLTEEDLQIKNRILRVKRCTQPTERQLNSNKNKNTQGFNSNPNNKFNKKAQDYNLKQNFGGKFQGKQNEDRADGAYRRITNKRKYEENNDGPPSKRQNTNQPRREKKERKEFVGMTGEKKKKQKFNKGNKKKKALSEILTKK